MLREHNLDILSRLPERFSLAEELMAQAQADSPTAWEDLGVIRSPQGKKAASYRVWQTEAFLAGAVYRFLVVASSTLDKRHLKALERAETEEVTQYQKLVKGTEAQWFSERQTAEAELKNYESRITNYEFRNSFFNSYFVLRNSYFVTIS